MSIDTRQFLQTFYEESFEGLAIMESMLLNIDYGNVDSEQVDTIFRAAHSIKGGGGTFGVTEIADFTHALETLLDQVRDGTLALNEEIVNELLGSVDLLRNMLVKHQAGSSVDSNVVDAQQANLEKYIVGDASTKTKKSKTSPQHTGSKWRIYFAPYEKFFKTGNDPIRFIRELSGLGELTVKVDTGKLPAWKKFESDICYLSWILELKAKTTKEVIEEIFEWVAEDCELKIQEVRSDSQSGAKRNTAGNSSSGAAEVSSIRVSIEKIDALVNMVGELVITQSMLNEFSDDFDEKRIHTLQQGLVQLERNTRELQENVMRIRMLPISFIFNRFPRLVHDVSQKLNKKVQLKLTGEQTELDKNVMEKIGDPLVHLVRNAMDHGIEDPEQRLKAGKDEMGTIYLNAYHQGGNIVIVIEDDGAGIDKEKVRTKALENQLVSEEELNDDKVFDLIFMPGFSTATAVSDLSGRGVGMDVVRRNIRELGGTVEVSSEQGRGSKFTIVLPLTLAILDGQLIRVGEDVFVISLVSIVESLQLKADQVNSIAGKSELFKLREDYIPVIRLRELFNNKENSNVIDMEVSLESDPELDPELDPNRELEDTSKDIIEVDADNDDGLLVVVEGDGEKVGLVVDELLAQQQVVVKSLETNYQKVDGFSGATILGDGTVALILDISSLVKYVNDRKLDTSKTCIEAA